MKFTWLIALSTSIPKIIFLQGGPNFGGGKAGKFRENGQYNRDIHCDANRRGVVNFEREYWPLPPGIKILVVPQFSYMPDQMLGKKRKNSIFRLQFDPSLRPSPPKM